MLYIVRELRIFETTMPDDVLLWCGVLLASILLTALGFRRRLKPMHTDVRHSSPPADHEGRPSTSPPRSPVPNVAAREPETDERPSCRRRGQGLGPADTTPVAPYFSSIESAPKEQRNHPTDVRPKADFRVRLGEPFELSYFRARCAALRPVPSHECWWLWLASDGRASALHDCVVTLLAAASDEARAHCIALLDVWLLQGALDAFGAFRGELSKLEQAEDGRPVSLYEIQAREADACVKYSKDWLLASVLDTLLPALRSEGVVAAQATRKCPVCDPDVYDPNAPGFVPLICFIPCGHWLCQKCFVDWKVRMGETEPSRCATCNTKAWPFQKDWPGTMVRQ